MPNDQFREPEPMMLTKPTEALACSFSAQNEGMTPINHALWYSFQAGGNYRGWLRNPFRTT